MSKTLENISKIAGRVLIPVLFVTSFAFGGVYTLAEEGKYSEENGVVVTCNTELDENGRFTNPCGFNNFMNGINIFIDFLLYYMVLPIAVLVIMYAGFLYLTSGDNSGQREKAKGALMNIVIGLIIALAAWIAVKFVLDTLGYEDTLGIFE